MGRVTYEEMAGFWPTSTDDYAAPMNEIPKVVFSKTLSKASWPKSSIARGNSPTRSSRSRTNRGGEIIAWGGATSRRLCQLAGLVDQYAIVHQPVAFGAGVPIFRGLPDALHLGVVAAMAFPSGTTLNIYEPLGWGHQVRG